MEKLLQQGQWAEPLVRWANPPEAETPLVFERAMEAANLPVFNILKRKKYSQISVFSCKNDF